MLKQTKQQEGSGRTPDITPKSGLELSRRLRQNESSAPNRGGQAKSVCIVERAD